MRLHGTARVGILALCVGIVVFVSVHYWVNTRTLVPLDISVTLAPGHLQTRDFKINVDAYLSVQIRFQIAAQTPTSINVYELGSLLQQADRQFPLLARPTGRSPRDRI